MTTSDIFVIYIDQCLDQPSAERLFSCRKWEKNTENTETHSQTLCNEWQTFIYTFLCLDSGKLTYYYVFCSMKFLCNSPCQAPRSGITNHIQICAKSNQDKLIFSPGWRNLLLINLPSTECPFFLMDIIRDKCSLFVIVSDWDLQQWLHKSWWIQTNIVRPLPCLYSYHFNSSIYDVGFLFVCCD